MKKLNNKVIDKNIALAKKQVDKQYFKRLRMSSFGYQDKD